MLQSLLFFCRKKMEKRTRW